MKIQFKKGYGTPANNQLDIGEIGIDMLGKIIWTKDYDENIIKLSHTDDDILQFMAQNNYSTNPDGISTKYNDNGQIVCTDIAFDIFDIGEAYGDIQRDAYDITHTTNDINKLRIFKKGAYSQSVLPLPNLKWFVDTKVVKYGDSDDTYIVDQTQYFTKKNMYIQIIYPLPKFDKITNTYTVNNRSFQRIGYDKSNMEYPPIAWSAWKEITNL